MRARRRLNLGGSPFLRKLGHFAVIINVVSVLSRVAPVFVPWRENRWMETIQQSKTYGLPSVAGDRLVKYNSDLSEILSPDFASSQSKVKWLKQSPTKSQIYLIK